MNDLGWGASLKQLIAFVSVYLIAFVLSGQEPKASKFEAVKKLYLTGQISEAYNDLHDFKDGELSKEEKGLKYFTLGVWANELNRVIQARENLQKSLEYNTPEAPYVHYLLGIGHKREGQIKKAREHFEKSLRLKPPRNIVYQIHFEKSELDIEEKRWYSAYKHLRYLKRKWRNTPRYPEVLWRLIKVELKRNRKWRACYYARRMYSRTPAHPLVYDWGIDLQESSFEGKKLGCIASQQDQRNRVRRLQWAGEKERADAELQQLQARAEGDTKYQVDSLKAEFLVNEGLVTEALNILLSYHESQNKNFDYLMLLAKASSRAGEYQVAVGAYYKAHKLRSRSGEGKKALFHAAFLSYQFQDYDGASRKFSEFVRKYPRSALARDSQWHLAWVRYLKGDYAGAAKDLQALLKKKQRSRRSRWRWRKFTDEKIKYWLAMSYLKNDEHLKAQAVFESLLDDKLLDYYTFAAQYRLDSIPKNEDNVKRKLASLHGTLHKRNLEQDIEQLKGEEKPPEGLEDEADESITELKEYPDEDDDKEPDFVAEFEGDAMANDKNPRIRNGFERAKDLIKVGLHDWAKWELYEIERRTKNHSYLKMLMGAYEDIGSYNRSSYVGAIYFSGQRKRYGVNGVRYLWEFAYPQAYVDFVRQYASRFDVDKNFIWSIMRAESKFRHDIVSPVGAKGLMQIMPFTGRKVASLLNEHGFHDRMLTDPETNIRLGSRYLNRLLEKFDGQIPLAAAGYNAGPHRVQTWLASFGKLDMDEFIEHIPFIETRNYVKKVVRNYGIYSLLYDNKTSALPWLSQPVPVEVDSVVAREVW